MLLETQGLFLWYIISHNLILQTVFAYITELDSLIIEVCENTKFSTV